MENIQQVMGICRGTLPNIDKAFKRIVQKSEAFLSRSDPLLHAIGRQDFLSPVEFLIDFIRLTKLDGLVAQHTVVVLSGAISAQHVQ